MPTKDRKRVQRERQAKIDSPGYECVTFAFLRCWM